jgi:hypothetical protein
MGALCENAKTTDFTTRQTESHDRNAADFQIIWPANLPPMQNDGAV